jgi:putative membrane protein insertion efficiency factor
MRRFALWLLFQYKQKLSPLLLTQCRFTPTCSEYAMDAFEYCSFFKACFLTLYRLLRCHPFCYGGFDPLLLPPQTTSSPLTSSLEQQ